MKFLRFTSTAIVVTLFSLLYVYQQSEIYRLAYVGQKRQSCFEELLDKNRLLRYNIKRNISLVQIGSKISGSRDFQMPDSYRLVRLSSPEGTRQAGAFVSARVSLFSRIFGIKRQAEANTINP